MCSKVKSEGNLPQWEGEEGERDKTRASRASENTVGMIMNWWLQGEKLEY